MFPKWYKDLIKEKLKGTNHKVTFFMSYPQAMMHNAVEVLFYIYSAVMVLTFIDKNVGSIAGTIALFVLFAIWGKMLNSNQYYMMNLSFKPPAREDKIKELLRNLDE